MSGPSDRGHSRRMVGYSDRSQLQVDRSTVVGKYLVFIKSTPDRSRWRGKRCRALVVVASVQVALSGSKGRLPIHRRKAVLDLPLYSHGEFLHGPARSLSARQAIADLCAR